MTDGKVARILDAVLDAAEQLIDFDCFYVAMYNRVTAELEFPLVVRKNGDERTDLDGNESMFASRPFRPDERLPDYLFSCRAPVLIESSFRSWLRSKRLKYSSGVGRIPTSWLGVPLMARDSVMGVVAVERLDRRETYTRGNQHTLSAICNRAASVLAGDLLVNGLRALNRVGQTLASAIRISEQEIIELIYEQARSLMDTRNMYIARFDPTSNLLSFPLAYQDGIRQYDWKPRSIDSGPGGLTEAVIRKGELVCPDDVQAWYDSQNIKPAVKPIPRSWLGVPIKKGHAVLGVIALQNDDIQNLYGLDDREVVQTMAAQAAISLDNTLLFQKVTSLHQMGIRISSSTDLSTILSLILEKLNGFLGADFSTLIPYDSERSAFSPGIRVGTLAAGPTVPSNAGFAAEVAETQRPVWYDDALEATRKYQSAPDFVERHEVRSFGALPVVSGTTTYGVMFVNFLSKHDFSYQDMIIGQLLANQAATAIQNAGLANAKEQQQREEQVRAMLTVATRFAGEFAHKLTSVVGTTPTWIELAAEQLSGSDVEKDVLRYLQAIKTELSELDDVAQLYERSLADTGDQSETREWIAVQDLIESVVNRVSNSMPKSVGQVAVVIHCHPRWLRVRTTRYNLSSVLYNLIRNAYEAMPDRGELSVGCVVESNARSSIIITVHDTGVGIPDNQIGKIFDPGFTTKGHMGVGLMYVKEIVESMGGQITPKSEVGKGTTITVMLPMEVHPDSDAQFT